MPACVNAIEPMDKRERTPAEQVQECLSIVLLACTYCILVAATS
jgi:hypothetical protein